MQADRTLSAFGTKTFFRGAMIGCYTCHKGPGNDSSNTSTPPTVNICFRQHAKQHAAEPAVTVTPATATLRIISQPANGSLGVSSNVLTYFPNAGFAGNDTFTYAAWDTSKNSTLATGTVSVAQGPYSLGLVSHVATNAPSGWPVAFAAVADSDKQCQRGGLQLEFRRWLRAQHQSICPAHFCRAGNLFVAGGGNRWHGQRDEHG